MKRMLCIITLILTLSGCSKNTGIEPVEPITLADSNTIIINAFDKEEYAELNVLRNRFKRENSDELIKLDEMIAKEITKSFMTCENLPRLNGWSEVDKFNEEFLVFHTDSLSNFEDTLSKNYISCLNTYDYGYDDLLYINHGVELGYYNFLLKDDVINLISQYENEVYNEIVKIIDDRDFEEFSEKSEEIVGALQNLRLYKDGDKYCHFAMGLEILLDDDPKAKSLEHIFHHLSQAYGIPGFKGKYDLERLVPGMSLYHKLEGIWVGQNEYLRKDDSYSYLKFENYQVYDLMVYSWQDAGSTSFPTYGDSLYYVDGKLIHGNPNGGVFYKLSGNKLITKHVTYNRVR